MKNIVKAIVFTKRKVNLRYPIFKTTLSEDVHFVTTQELEDRWPDKTSKEREDLIAKEFGTVFIMQIGGKLKSGQRHDGRAPDYDDWSLNGDLFFWNETLQKGIEISSMGVRVDETSLQAQLAEADALDRNQYEYHKLITNGTLPLTIGGGIGQSRLCMLLLEKAHIGEVQASIWPDDMIQACAEHGITLL